MRARYYEPTLGRFLSEDPIGLSGGVNTTAFVKDDPVNLGDPNGLGPCLTIDIPFFNFSICFPSGSPNGSSWVSWRLLQERLATQQWFLDQRNGSMPDLRGSELNIDLFRLHGPPGSLDNQDSQATSCSAPVGEFTYGIGGLIHPGLYSLGLGVEGGVNTAGQFFIRPYGQAGLGLGVYAGAGTSGGMALGSPYQRGVNPFLAGQLTANAAWGAIGHGIAVTADQTSVGISGSTRGFKGIGIGAQASGGLQAGTTIASRQWARPGC